MLVVGEQISGRCDCGNWSIDLEKTFRPTQIEIEEYIQHLWKYKHLFKVGKLPAEKVFTRENELDEMVRTGKISQVQYDRLKGIISPSEISEVE